MQLSAQVKRYGCTGPLKFKCTLWMHVSKRNCADKEGADISRSYSSYVSCYYSSTRKRCRYRPDHETLSLTASSFLEQRCRAELWKCKINIFFRCHDFPKNQWLPNTFGFVAFRRGSLVLLTRHKVYFESKPVASVWSFYSSRTFCRHEQQTWRGIKQDYMCLDMCLSACWQG